MLIPYAAPAEPFHKETEIKKSIFIAHLVPVNSEEEAQKTLEGFRKQYKDATHNCYAWRIGTERVLEKSGDDGEPSGTAGHPMLHVLQMQKLTNLLAVVTRYFGGIKLGTSGLIGAYREAARQAIASAVIVECHEQARVTFNFPYLSMNDVMKIVKADEKIHVIDQKFDNDCLMTLETDADRLPPLKQRLLDVTGLAVISG